MFIIIIILGMDKEPSGLNILLNGYTTPISNYSYNSSTKVRDHYIFRTLIESPGLRFWQLSFSCLHEFGYSQRQFPVEIATTALRGCRKNVWTQVWIFSLAGIRTLKKIRAGVYPNRRSFFANLKLDKIVLDGIVKLRLNKFSWLWGVLTVYPLSKLELPLRQSRCFSLLLLL